MLEPMTRQCKYCNKPFESRRKDAIFCRRNCKNNFFVTQNRRKIKQKAVDYLGGSCKECGYNKCITAMDFHHLDPSQKDFGIGSGNSLSWDKIQKELDKCVLLCCRCHRELHAEDILYPV